jgi:uncharacterized protein
MPINASHEFITAEKKYLEAQTTNEKIACLEEMIRVSPKHKGSENLLKELRTRLKKLLDKKDKSNKSKSASKKGIRKENFQCILLGLPNTGKSSILKALTNAHPKTSPNPFTTQEPQIGTLDYQGVKAQIIDLPSIGSENLDLSLINSADLILITITSLQDLEKINPIANKNPNQKIIIYNKIDLLSNEQIRKLNATIKSKRLPAILFSTLNNYNITELKDLILKSMNIIRVFTKLPGKPKSTQPIVLPTHSTVKQVAEKILKGFSIQIKYSILTGPSSKFPNQRVGLSHVCKDLDTIEFHTK